MFIAFGSRAMIFMTEPKKVYPFTNLRNLLEKSDYKIMAQAGSFAANEVLVGIVLWFITLAFVNLHIFNYL